MQAVLLKFPIFVWAGILLLTSAAGNGFTLTLSEALKEALEKSPSIRQAEIQLRKARLEEPSLLALTDPVFNIKTLESKDESPRSAPAIQGAYSRTRSLDLSLTQNLLIGTESQVFLKTQRLESPAIFRPLEPTVDTRLGFQIRQPFLRYFWGRPDVVRRKQARAGVAALEGALARVKEEEAARVAIAYLNLYVAQQEIVIATGALADAQRLKGAYQEKRRYGLVEASDFWQAEASLKVREIELQSAQSQLRRAEATLQEALYREGSAPVFMALYLPRAPLGDFPAEEETHKLAFLNRGDWISIQNALIRAESFARVEYLNTLPDLALFGSYGWGGLATRLNSSWQDTRGFDHPIYAAGVEFSIALGQKQEKTRRERALLDVEAARSERDKLEAQIRRQVSEALERLKLALDNSEAYGLLLEAEHQKLAAAQEDFKRGRATTDILIRFQSDINRTESLLLRARSEVLTGWADLGFATGTLLERLSEMAAGGTP